MSCDITHFITHTAGNSVDLTTCQVRSCSLPHAGLSPITATRSWRSASLRASPSIPPSPHARAGVEGRPPPRPPTRRRTPAVATPPETRSAPPSWPCRRRASQLSARYTHTTVVTAAAARLASITAQCQPSRLALSRRRRALGHSRDCRHRPVLSTERARSVAGVGEGRAAESKQVRDERYATCQVPYLQHAVQPIQSKWARRGPGVHPEPAPRACRRLLAAPARRRTPCRQSCA